MAAKACGAFPDFQSAITTMSGGIRLACTPDPRTEAAYDRLYEVYREQSVPVIEAGKKLSALAGS